MSSNVYSELGYKRAIFHLQDGLAATSVHGHPMPTLMLQSYPLKSMHCQVWCVCVCVDRLGEVRKKYFF